MKRRDHNLDLLRATAISMVLVYHVCQRWPNVSLNVITITHYGQYGVDLFFVLSGWLIGGLFWREQIQFGNIEVGRFICRRALRTIPPYVIALVISYIGVFVMRHETFNWRYLFFLQNYCERMPYFLVSWSLCVEEHFYIALPAVALFLARFSRYSQGFFIILLVVPALCRAYDFPFEDRPFGYHFTASHMHYEGLLLGVWASFLYQWHPQHWASLQRFAPAAVILFILGIAFAKFLPERLYHAIFPTIIAIFFLLALLLVVNRHPLYYSDSKIVFWTASVSYSIYLTHAFALDASLRLAAKIPDNGIYRLIVIMLCIGFSGVIFFHAVEIPCLALRHRFLPRRGLN